MKRIRPFVDEATSLAIGDLTIENRLDRVSLSGSLDLTKDAAGLDYARSLREVLDMVVSTLEAEPALPASASVEGISSVPNPFAKKDG